MKTCSVFTSAIMASLIALPAPTYAQEDALIAPIVKMGILAAAEQLSDPYYEPDLATPLEFQSAATNAIQSYISMREAYTSAQSGGQDFQTISDAWLGGSVSARNLPGFIVGLGLSGVVGYGNAELDNQFRAQTRLELELVHSGIRAASGQNLYDLALEGPDRVRDLLMSNEQLMPEIHRLAREDGDPLLLATVANSMAQQAHELARDGVRLNLDNAADINEIGVGLKDHILTMDAAFSQSNLILEEHSTRLSSLEADVDKLQVSVSELDNRVGQLGGNQDLIADLMFSRLSPAERVTALERGLYDNRITCPVGAAQCDATAIKSALIERYQSEVNIQRTVASIGSVISNAGTALKIAGDLGIDVPPEIAQGIQIAQAAFTAVTTFATNPLGALSAVTGLFGSKRDAGAERHKQLMNYLAENFKNINEQLVSIQENQQKIMEGLVGVSEQIAALHTHLDGRLNILEQNVVVIDRNVRQLLWRDWEKCEAVLQYAIRPPGAETGYVDPQTLLFSTFENRRIVTDNVGAETETCISKARDAATALRSTGNWQRFGTFLDLERNDVEADLALRNRLQEATAREGLADYQTATNRYINAMVSPSARVLSEWAVRNEIDPVTLLLLLVESPTDLASLNAQIARVAPLDDGTKGWRVNCNIQSELPLAIAEVTCLSDEPQNMAARMLTVALAPEVFHDASRWVVVTSQLADLYGGSQEGFASSIDEMLAMSDVDAGYEMVATFTAIGNIVVAYEQRISGALTSLAIAEDVIEGRPVTDAHFRILTANPYLAENVATILLTRWRTETEPGWSDRKINFSDRYLQAILHSRSGADYPYEILQVLFGPERAFMLSADGRAQIVLETDAGQAFLPMPGPLQFEEGRFIMPPSHDQTVSARDAVLERLIGYNLGRADFMPVLLAGAAQP